MTENQQLLSTTALKMIATLATSKDDLCGNLAKDIARFALMSIDPDFVIKLRDKGI